MISQSRLREIDQTKLEGLENASLEEFHRRLIGIDPGLSYCAVCGRPSVYIWEFTPGDPENWVTHIVIDEAQPRRQIFWYGVCYECTQLPDLTGIIKKLLARERQALLS